LALVGGVVGARLAYIIENWDAYSRAGPGAWLDVTSGGLIYYGGVVLAMAASLAYMLWRRLPIRRYLDIVAVTLMLGLAFGRMGCTLHGCCWGGPARADWPLAIRFPMISRPLLKLSSTPGPYAAGQGLSPPYGTQYAAGRVRPDERLLNHASQRLLPTDDEAAAVLPLLPLAQLHGRLEKDQLTTMLATEAEARERFAALAGADGAVDRAEWQRGRADGEGFLRGSEAWAEVAPAREHETVRFSQAWAYLQDRRRRLVERFDADGDGRLVGPERAEANTYLQADLWAVVAEQRTAPLKPAQPLGVVNALVLAGMLFGFYRLRRREGQVFALLLILYPLTRFVLESIRADNPHDLLAGVLTHNQYSSLAIAVVGVIMMAVLQRLPASARPARGSGEGRRPRKPARS
jgi:phosphatidylglycerol:prolipoprotein diacylglycerol transferase